MLSRLRGLRGDAYLSALATLLTEELSAACIEIHEREADGSPGHVLARAGEGTEDLSGRNVLLHHGEELVGALVVGPAERLPDDLVPAVLVVVDRAGSEIAHTRDARTAVRHAAARRRAEHRTEILTRMSNDVVWEWEIATGRVDWSDTLTSAFGYARTSDTQRLDWWCARIHAADADRVKSSLDAVWAGGGTSWEEEYRFERADGAYVIVRDRCVIVRDESGSVERLIGAMHDITQQKELEARLLLSDRMASLGTLAAGIAHEINNPLAYIYANVESAILEIEAKPELSSTREALEDAMFGAARVRDIVRDLKTFSRPAGDELVAVDIDQVVESAARMAWNEVKHRAQLTKKLGAPRAVLATEPRLAQVVVNLLLNAAHAVEEKGVRAGEIVVLTGTDRDGNVFLEVEDDGPGMTPDVVARIFDPFFTTKRVGKGTGLGLFICHSIVSGFRGRIVVDSTPGRGTRVRVILPVADASVPSRVVPSEGGPATARARVLVVDDDVQIAACLSRMLSKHHDVHVVTLASGALDALSRGPAFDVVLCDVMMPDVDGIQLYTTVQRNLPEMAKRFVFMTGGAFTESTREKLSELRVPILEKPFELSTLLDAVARILRRTARREEAAAAS